MVRREILQWDYFSINHTVQSSFLRCLSYKVEIIKHISPAYCKEQMRIYVKVFSNQQSTVSNDILFKVALDSNFLFLAINLHFSFL